MQHRLRTLLPGQFRLVALFAWMTLAAVTCAIIRLPIRVEFKLIGFITVWSFFRLGLITFNKPVTPAARINNALLDVVGHLVLPMYFLWTMVINGGIRHPLIACLFVFMLLVAVVIPIGHAIFVIRAERAGNSSTAEP